MQPINVDVRPQMQPVNVDVCLQTQPVNVDVRLQTQPITVSMHNRLNLQIECWNMRTLVEAEGSIETSLTGPGSRRVTVDQKASLMVRELKKYRMNATGIIVRRSGSIRTERV